MRSTDPLLNDYKLQRNAGVGFLRNRHTLTNQKVEYFGSSLFHMDKFDRRRSRGTHTKKRKTHIFNGFSTQPYSSDGMFCCLKDSSNFIDTKVLFDKNSIKCYRLIMKD